MRAESILLVDDEVALLDLFTISLRDLPNPILKATSGADALEIMEKQPPALVILDIAMPDMTGLEVLRRIRSNPRLAGIKVLILTAVPLLMDQQATNLADSVITKPINLRALNEAVQSLLNAPARVP